jgi:hypothetical protein
VPNVFIAPLLDACDLIAATVVIGRSPAIFVRLLSLEEIECPTALGDRLLDGVRDDEAAGTHGCVVGIEPTNVVVGAVLGLESIKHRSVAISDAHEGEPQQPGD